MSRSICALPLLALLLTLQPLTGQQAVEDEAPDSETCRQRPQDEVGLLQTHARITSAHDARRQHATGLAKSGARAAPQGLSEWIAHVPSGLAERHSAIARAIAQHLPGRQKVSSFSSDGAHGGSIPAMTDGGEGVPVGECCWLVAALLVVGLVRWALESRCASAWGKEMPGGAEAGRPFEMRWWHVMVLMQIDPAVAFSALSYTASMPVIAEDLNTTDTMVGSTLQFNLVAGGICSVTFGLASDKYGRRPTMLTAQSCFVVGALLCAISPTVECLIAARCIMGIGTCQWAVMAVLQDCIQKDDERSQVAALIFMANTMALAVAPVMVALLLS